MDPLGFIMAMQAMEDHVQSAGPCGRTVVRKRSRIEPLRAKAAGALRRLADRVEPAAIDCRATQPHLTH